MKSRSGLDRLVAPGVAKETFGGFACGRLGASARRFLVGRWSAGGGYPRTPTFVGVQRHQLRVSKATLVDKKCVMGCFEKGDHL